MSAALYLVVYHMDSVVVDGLKKSKFDAITLCLQVFLFVRLHSSPKFVEEKKALCIHYSVAFFLPADTDHHNVPNKDRTL